MKNYFTGCWLKEKHHPTALGRAPVVVAQPPSPGTPHKHELAGLIATPCMYASHVPNLVLQEVHVPVEQGVGGREDAHGLHSCTPFQLTFHGHIGKAGQAEERPLSKVAKIDQNM